MKNLLLFLLIPFSCAAQQTAIANLKSNILYIGVDNPLDVVVENTPCETLILSTDNGAIRGKGCRYTAMPQTPGEMSLSVKKISGGDTLDVTVQKFRVKQIPNPTASIGLKNFGPVGRKFLIAHRGISTIVENFDIDVRALVTRFRMFIMRGDTLIASHTGKGYLFDEPIKASLAQIKSGDRVYFVDIYARVPGNPHEVKLNAIELEVE